MSKIALEPNAAGTGTFTIASPNSNTSRTLTLPDADGALLTTTGDGSQLTGIDTTPPTTFNAVGTYVWAHYVGSDISGGASVAASTLRRSDIQTNYKNDGDDIITDSNSYTFASGTWRYMGHKVLGGYLSGSNIYSPVALFVRIS